MFTTLRYINVHLLTYLSARKNYYFYTNIVQLTYEGHPINKLLNGIILLIFKIWKSNIHTFSKEFIPKYKLWVSLWWYHNSHLHFEQSVSAVFYRPLFFHNSRVLNSIASYEKNKQVQQAHTLKCQTVTFTFQHILHIHLSFYRIDQVITTESTAAIITSIVKAIQLSVRFFSTTPSRLWWNFLHQTCIAYWNNWHWMHFWVNGIGIKYLHVEKTIDRMLCLVGRFQR